MKKPKESKAKRRRRQSRRHQSSSHASAPQVHMTYELPRMQFTSAPAFAGASGTRSSFSDSSASRETFAELVADFFSVMAPTVVNCDADLARARWRYSMALVIPACALSIGAMLMLNFFGVEHSPYVELVATELSLATFIGFFFCNAYTLSFTYRCGGWNKEIPNTWTRRLGEFVLGNMGNRPRWAFWLRLWVLVVVRGLFVTIVWISAINDPAPQYLLGEGLVAIARSTPYFPWLLVIEAIVLFFKFGESACDDDGCW